MSAQLPETDRATRHDRFAMACNNRARELSTGSHSGADDAEMLDTAHASAWHWAQVGTELNCMRETMLLAEVHALLGMGERALADAEQMRAYFLGREGPDWEIAFSHAIDAHAAHAARRAAEHRDADAQAEAALAGVVDEDRAIVAATLRHVRPPA